MHTCMICEKHFENNFARHLKVHYKGNPIGKLAYFDEFYRDKLDIELEYTVNKISAAKLGLMVTEIAPFPVQKNDILNFLLHKGVDRRSTSEAIVVWSEKRGGPWNKGHTKHTHPSILRYSLSRMGKNNPVYSMTDNERRNKLCYWLFKSSEESDIIKQKIRNTLRRKYKSGEILHVSVSNPEKHAKIIRSMQEGLKNAYEQGLIKKQGSSSSHEKRISKILKEKNIEHRTQKSIDKKYRYDFFIPHMCLLLEINGDYWHCSPLKYEKEFFHPHKKIKAYEIWEYDKEKAELAKSLGYNFHVIWEHEISRLSDLELKEFILETIENLQDCQER